MMAIHYFGTIGTKTKYAQRWLYWIDDYPQVLFKNTMRSFANNSAPTIYINYKYE